MRPPRECTKSANLPDLRLEDAQRVGIGEHQSRRFIRHGAVELGKVNATARIGFDVPNLVTRNGGAGGIRSVRRIGDQDVFPRVAALAQAGADHQYARQFALRARRRLKRDRVHAGDFLKAARCFVENFQTALDQSFRSVGMVRSQALQARHLFIDPRVVLHGAGTQRIEARVHSVIPGGKAREVTDDFQFRDLRKALDFAPAELWAQEFFR